MILQLTQHFSLEELTVTQHRGINNTPPAEVVEQLRVTAQGLERIRSLLKSPIIVTSGYRCLELNRAIGSKDTSQHVTGHAADFICPAFGEPREVCRVLSAMMVDLSLDQLILEYPERGGWTHVSFSATPRHMALTINDSGVHAGIA